MTSNDEYVTVQVLKSETGQIRAEIKSGFEQISKEFKEVRAEIQTVKDIAIANSAKIDAYRDFTSIWFTVIAIVVALVGIMVTLAPMFREMYRDSKKSNLKNTIREVINEEIDATVKSALSPK